MRRTQIKPYNTARAIQETFDFFLRPHTRPHWERKSGTQLTDGSGNPNLEQPHTRAPPPPPHTPAGRHLKIFFLRPHKRLWEPKSGTQLTHGPTDSSGNPNPEHSSHTVPLGTQIRNAAHTRPTDGSGNSNPEHSSHTASHTAPTHHPTCHPGDI